MSGEAPRARAAVSTPDSGSGRTQPSVGTGGDISALLTVDAGRGRGVLDGALRLLDVLSRTVGGAGLSELAREANVPKASAYRLMEQLVELGAAQRYEQRYFVGPRLARLGRAWEPHPGLQSAAREPVGRLSALSSTIVMVTVLHHQRIRAVVATRGVVTEVPRVQAFDEFPTQTAAGRLLMSHQGPDAVNDAQLPGLTRGEWQRARAELRSSGPSVVDREEVLPGMCCVAAPVHGGDGQVIAAISALAIKPAVPPGLIELVIRAAGEVSRNLERVT